MVPKNPSLVPVPARHVIEVPDPRQDLPYSQDPLVSFVYLPAPLPDFDPSPWSGLRSLYVQVVAQQRLEPGQSGLRACTGNKYNMHIASVFVISPEKKNPVL